jgi:ADP-ribose pyrophosphatase YjhB (NUDIX family)
LKGYIVSNSPTSVAPIGDGQEVRLRADGQEWILTWHRPDAIPDGKPHGSTGICVTPEADAVLSSADGVHWGLPGGRPEGDEDWEQTLRREMLEEACAVVDAARLLGFSRGHCVRGHQQGLVLVRAIWRADVELRPWVPRFEIAHRRLVSARELLSHLTPDNDGYLPTYRRAMLEAGL